MYVLIMSKVQEYVNYFEGKKNFYFVGTTFFMLNPRLLPTFCSFISFTQNLQIIYVYKLLSRLMLVITYILKYTFLSNKVKLHSINLSFIKFLKISTFKHFSVFDKNHDTFLLIYCKVYYTDVNARRYSYAISRLHRKNRF